MGEWNTRSRGPAQANSMTEANGSFGVRVPLPDGLLETRFVERPNRFLLRCAPVYGAVAGGTAVGARLVAESSPSVVEAHMADPGRLRELLVPGRRVWLRPADGAGRRRTRWTAVLVERPDGAGVVSLDSTLPNRLIHRALLAGALDELAGWTLNRAEARVGRSRFDFVLGKPDGRRLALEVKSVTLVEDGIGMFPDAVTARGARHVRELAELAQRDGWEAAVLFVLQRPDATRIVAAADIDPEFAQALADAERVGVRVLGRRCHVSLEGVTLGDPVPAGSDWADVPAS